MSRPSDLRRIMFHTQSASTIFSVPVSLVATVPLRKGLMVPRRKATGKDADHATWYYYQNVDALQATPAHVQFGGGHEQLGLPFYFKSDVEAKIREVQVENGE